MEMAEKILDDFINLGEKNMIEMKRIYRCPNCDVMVLKKVYFNTNHFCSCGVITHVKNLKLEFEVK